MIDIEEYILKPLIERISHIKQDEPCLERGGISTYFKGMMAHILDTTMPKGMKIHVCHYCGNGKCSNPNHLYFGTCKENVADAIRHGTFINGWERLVKLYGEDEARKIQRARFVNVRPLGTIASPLTKKKVKHV